MLSGTPTLATSTTRHVFNNQHWFAKAFRSDGGLASVGGLVVGGDSRAPKPQAPTLLASARMHVGLDILPLHCSVDHHQHSHGRVSQVCAQR